MSGEVFHLNSNTDSGGAAISATALHAQMESLGILSTFINFKTNDPSQRIMVLPFRFRLISKIIEKIFLFSVPDYKKNILSLDIASTGVGTYLDGILDPTDTLIVHWIGKELVSLNDITRLRCRKILIVHDLWYCGGMSHVDISEQRGYLENIHHVQKSRLLNTCDSVIVPSKFMQKSLKKYTSREIHLFRNEMPITNPPPLRKIYERHGIVLGSADITDRHKGGDLLVCFVKSLRNRSKQIPITVVGNLCGEVEKLLLKYNCNVPGRLNRDDLQSLMGNSKSYVSLSRVDNFPNMMIEAGLLGCRLYGFDIGGHPEIVFNSKIGSLVDLEDVNTLSDLVVNEYSYAVDADEISGLIRSIFDNYSTKNFMEKFVSVEIEK